MISLSFLSCSTTEDCGRLPELKLFLSGMPPDIGPVDDIDDPKISEPGGRLGV